MFDAFDGCAFHREEKGKAKKIKALMPIFTKVLPHSFASTLVSFVAV